MEKPQDKERIRLSEYFLRPPPPRKRWDKYYQEFERFVKYIVNRYINHIRQTEKINLKVVKNIIDKCIRIAQKCEDFNNPQFRKNWLKLENYANAKIDSNVAKRLLGLAERPFIWEESLNWYILTGQIHPVVSHRCVLKLDEEKNKVILELSPDATIRDIKAQWRSIEKFQSYLSGYEIKRKHSIDDKKVKEQVKIMKGGAIYRKKIRIPKKEYDDAIRKYRDIGVNELKARDRYRLVERHNPEVIDDKNKQKKEEARQRQIYRRYKKYL